MYTAEIRGNVRGGKGRLASPLPFPCVLFLSGRHFRCFRNDKFHSSASTQSGPGGARRVGRGEEIPGAFQKRLVQGPLVSSAGA